MRLAFSDPPAAPASEGRGDFLHGVLRSLVLVGVALVPTVISYGGYDHFRIPKELLLYAVTIIGACVTALGLLFGRLTLPSKNRSILILGAVALTGFTWAAISAGFSTNRVLSLRALTWLGALITLFFLLAYVVKRASIRAVATAIILPAIVNAVVVTLQAFEIWNPWVFPAETAGRMRINALLGNPDDVAVYLVGPALFACALSRQIHHFRKLLTLVTAFLLGAIVLTETMTGIVAIACGIAALLIHQRRDTRRGALAAKILSVLLVFGCVVMAYEPTRTRSVEALKSLQRNQWDQLLRGRLIPLVTAWRMFTDHPVTGVGPGAFRYNYMRYRVEVSRDYPALAQRRSAAIVNFGELHNDHVQVLAETGLPGLMAALGALLLLARLSFRPVNGAADPRSSIARDLAMPFSLLLFLVMLPQFPWHLAAPASANILIAAVCFAWTPE